MHELEEHVRLGDIIIKWSGTLIALGMMMPGCATPNLFQFQNIGYFTSSSAQAQLGNVGTMSASDGFGFQRAAFLSDCQDAMLPVSIDATVMGLVAIRRGFGPGTRTKDLSARLGIPVTQVENTRILLLSINPLDAQRAASTWPAECKNMVARNVDRARVILSVAVLVSSSQLTQNDMGTSLSASVAPRGHVTLTIHGKKTRQELIAPQQVFAWRSGHFCWPLSTDGAPVLRSDDDGYADCPNEFALTAPPGSPWSIVPAAAKEDVVEEVALESDSMEQEDSEPESAAE